MKTNQKRNKTPKSPKGDLKKELQSERVAALLFDRIGRTKHIFFTFALTTNTLDSDEKKSFYITCTNTRKSIVCRKPAGEFNQQSHVGKRQYKFDG